MKITVLLSLLLPMFIRWFLAGLWSLPYASPMLRLFCSLKLMVKVPSGKDSGQEGVIAICFDVA